MKNDKKLADMLYALGLDEEPMGVIWTDKEPPDCVSPKAQKPISREAEEKGEIDWQSVMENFACVLGIIWRARKKNAAACFDAERFGCLGGAFYLGFMRPYLKNVMKSATSIPGVAVAALVCSLFLLPCSSGPYLMVLSMIAESVTVQALLYLVIYNLIKQVKW